jgi:hypothetical protein
MSERVWQENKPTLFYLMAKTKKFEAEPLPWQALERTAEGRMQSTGDNLSPVEKGLS